LFSGGIERGALARGGVGLMSCLGLRFSLSARRVAVFIFAREHSFICGRGAGYFFIGRGDVGVGTRFTTRAKPRSLAWETLWLRVVRNLWETLRFSYLAFDVDISNEGYPWSCTGGD